MQEAPLRQRQKRKNKTKEGRFSKLGKEEIFSKLNIKDYNNKLEKIIAKKAFSEDTKNLLLNMLYKVEISYDDYSKVKVETKLKKDILEEILDIINRDCNTIELVKPELKENKVLKDKKSIGIKKEKKIITYPNENAVMYAIYTIKRKSFEISGKNSIIKKSLGYILDIGNNIDITEIIRDFDGWSWNINIGSIEDLEINLVYQTIQSLVGNTFLQDWINNDEELDYVKMFEEVLVKKYGTQRGQEIYKLICQTSILIYLSENPNEKIKILEEQKKLIQRLEKIENKKGYLQGLANKKKEIGKKIREIDKRINNSELLKAEFMRINKEAKEEEKIFSLSDFSDMEQDERDRLLGELKKYSILMEPMVYIETKNDLKRKVDIIGGLNLEEGTEGETKHFILLLQKAFLKGFEETIKKTTVKREVESFIYKMRYYKFIPFEKGQYIKDVEELRSELYSVEKALITKACKLKVINILSNDIETNYKVISNLLNTRIIDLNEAVFELKKKDNKTVVNIYEENLIDFTGEYDYIEDVNIKYNKKIKLFV